MLIVSCKAKKIQLQHSKSFCLGTEGDGGQIIGAWGSSIFQKDALKEAQKKALIDVIFKGMADGNGKCEVKPVIVEVNAQEKYSAYFNTFFGDQGEYFDYLILLKPNKKKYDRISDKKKSKENLYYVEVKIDLLKLRNKFITDNIIKL